MIDAVFYMVDVLLPMPPSKPLFALNAECAGDLRRVGFRPPDLKTQVGGREGGREGGRVRGL